MRAPGIVRTSWMARASAGIVVGWLIGVTHMLPKHLS
jgi:hypothetical protein